MTKSTILNSQKRRATYEWMHINSVLTVMKTCIPQGCVIVTIAMLNDTFHSPGNTRKKTALTKTSFTSALQSHLRGLKLGQQFPWLNFQVSVMIKSLWMCHQMLTKKNKYKEWPANGIAPAQSESSNFLMKLLKIRCSFLTLCKRQFWWHGICRNSFTAAPQS